MTRSAPTPFQLHSIAFAYPGNRGTIPLRDPRTSRFLGDEPEWNADGRRVAAAFVRGSRPGVRGQHEIRRVTLETTCRFTCTDPRRNR